MKRSSLFILSVLLLAITLSGCVYLTHPKELLFLKGLADSQAEMETYVKEQENRFAQLKADIQNGRLRKGMPKEEIIATYSEPISCNVLQEASGIQQRCMYRHPTQYFSSDWVYLDFDAEALLISSQLLAEPLKNGR